MRKQTGTSTAWSGLERRIVACRRCPRLIEHCREVARVRRRAYRDQRYWGRPVPGFGSRVARILMLGLAPAAHGANRTGRMFTGDRSGDWLYGALHRIGLASQPESTARDDGLRLRDVFISATCRCAPPGNRPTPEEMARCEPFLDRELELLSRLRVTVALGRIAWDAALRRARRIAPRDLPRPRPVFAHGAVARLPLREGRPPIWLLGSYHPSQQNTQTGRLTRTMFDSVLRRAVELAAGRVGPAGIERGIRDHPCDAPRVREE
jgi:uracil-DNA glycosylase family 4